MVRYTIHVDQQRLCYWAREKEEFDSNRSRLVAGKASKTAIKRKLDQLRSNVLAVMIKYVKH